MKKTNEILCALVLLAVSASGFSQERVAPQIPEEMRRQISDFMQQQFNQNKQRLDTYQAAGRSAAQGKDSINPLDTNVSDEVLVTRIGGAIAGLAQRFKFSDFRLPKAAERRRYAEEQKRPSILIPDTLYQDLLAYESRYAAVSAMLRDAAPPPRLWSMLASIISTSGAEDDAERAFGVARELLKKLDLLESPVAVEVALDYSDFLRTTGKYNDAIQLARAQESRIREMMAQSSGLFSFQGSGSKTIASFQMARVKYINADIMNSFRRYGEAESIAREGIGLGPTPYTGPLMMSLATALLGKKGNGKEAQEILTESLRMATRSGFWGAEGGTMAEVVFSSLIAMALIDQGQYPEAEATVVKALGKYKADAKYYRPDSSFGRMAESYANYALAKALRLQGKRDVAAAAATQAVEKGRKVSDTFRGFSVHQLAERGLIQEYLDLHVPGGKEGGGLDDRVFDLVQRSASEGTALAVLSMAERHEAKDATLAELIRDRQDLLNQIRRSAMSAFGNASAPPLATKSPDVRSIVDSMPEPLSSLSEIDSRLMKEFPNYSSLLVNTPVALSDIQRVLNQDEALVGWVITEDGAWGYVVRSVQARIFRLPAGANSLIPLKQALRQALELDSAGPGIFPAKKWFIAVFRETQP